MHTANDYVSVIQSVRMKCIQNKKFISQKLSCTYPVYVIGKEDFESSFMLG
jgi:hypothetical protein